MLTYILIGATCGICSVIGYATANHYLKSEIRGLNATVKELRNKGNFLFEQLRERDAKFTNVTNAIIETAFGFTDDAGDYTGITKKVKATFNGRYRWMTMTEFYRCRSAVKLISPFAELMAEVDGETLLSHEINWDKLGGERV
jgi:hypothetical protein